MSRTTDVFLSRKSMALQSRVGVKRRTLQLQCGGVISMKTNDDLCPLLAVERWFEPTVRRAIEGLLRPGDTMIDVGANVGYYTVLAGLLVGPSGRVLAFEPQEAVHAELERNVALNCLGNVQTWKAGLGESRHEARFYVPESGRESLGSLRSNGRFPVAKETTIQVLALDDVLRERGGSQVRLMKIDAEGAELSVLRGAAQLLESPERPYLIFEANETNTEPFGYSVYDVLSYVSSKGYKVTQLDSEDWFAAPVDARIG